MSRTVGILIFDDVEELDFVGPWEVFTMANEVAKRFDRPQPFTMMLLAENPGPVRCAKGLQVLPDTRMAEISSLDVLLVPGGMGTRREVGNELLLSWIAAIAERAEWVTSVCTGALLLTAAGPARGKSVTTHHAFVDTLAGRGEAGEVLTGRRYVRDGNLVTAAGVSAGIDMALWLVSEICGNEFAKATRKAMQYDPEPPV